MIDLHAHIVPGVDDGARSLSDSLEMARMAAKSGVQDLQTRQESLEDMFLRMYGGRNE